MALILETGVGVLNANSYVSVAEADAYHLLYAHVDWVGVNALKEAALVQATQSVDLNYGSRYKSVPLLPIHSLLFPRQSMLLNEVQLLPAGTIPVQLKRAVIELALYHIQGVDLFPPPNMDNFIQSKSVGIAGGPSKSVTYMKLPQNETLEGMNKIELLLAPILRSSSNVNPSLEVM